MNEGEIAAFLVKEAGYKVRGRLPSGWVLRAPDGRLVHENNLLEELNKLTSPGPDTKEKT